MAIRITKADINFGGPGSYSIPSQSPINTLFGISSPVTGINDKFLNFNFSATNTSVSYNTNNHVDGFDTMSVIVI
jgi:hypothetical protein